MMICRNEREKKRIAMFYADFKYKGLGNTRELTVWNPSLIFFWLVWTLEIRILQIRITKINVQLQTINVFLEGSRVSRIERVSDYLPGCLSTVFCSS